MSGYCDYTGCEHNLNGKANALFCKACSAHKPDPNESVSSARTTGSPAASSPESIGTTGVQLAYSLGSGAACIENSDGVCPYCGATLDGKEDKEHIEWCRIN